MRETDFDINTMSALGDRLWKCWKTVRSSANKDGVPPSDDAGCTTSLKNTFHKGGPRTVPWKTVSVMTNSSEAVPSIATVALPGCK